MRNVLQVTVLSQTVTTHLIINTMEIRCSNKYVNRNVMLGIGIARLLTDSIGGLFVGTAAIARNVSARLVPLTGMH